MAICDHEYKFSLIDVGSYGYMSDSGIFSDSMLSEGLFNGLLHMPDELYRIPNSNIQTPLYLVGDNAFPFSTKLMKPYSGNFLGEGKRIFNYRISRARRIIENTFGIMSSRWRILYTNISTHPQRVDNIVMAIICLHNFLMTVNNNEKKNNRRYCPRSYIDQEMDNGRITLGK